MCLHGGSINRLPSSLIASKGVIKKRPEWFFFILRVLLFIITFFSSPRVLLDTYTRILPSVSPHRRQRLFELLSLESRYRVSVCEYTYIVI